MPPRSSWFRFCCRCLLNNTVPLVRLLIFEYNNNIPQSSSVESGEYNNTMSHNMRGSTNPAVVLLAVTQLGLCNFNIMLSPIITISIAANITLLDINIVKISIRNTYIYMLINLYIYSTIVSELNNINDSGSEQSFIFGFTTNRLLV